MTQYIFDSGAVLNVTSIPEFANLNTQQLSMEEIRILVDTSIPRTVILPYSSLFPVRNVKITVVDITGLAATNNITVQASAGAPNDTIGGGATKVIDVAFAANRFEVLNNNLWELVNGSPSIPAATVTDALNGLHLNGTVVYLGGALLENTEIDQAGFNMSFVNGATAIASFAPTGQITLGQYPNNRDDTGTFTPTSLFYPGANGEVYVTPISSIIFTIDNSGLWATNAGLDDLQDVRSSISAGAYGFVAGVGAINNSENGVVIGSNATSNSNGMGIVIGSAENGVNADFSVVIAASNVLSPSTNTGFSSILIGADNTNSGVQSNIIGCGAGNIADRATMIVTSSAPGTSNNSGAYSTLIGYDIQNTASNSVCIGDAQNITASTNVISLGSNVSTGVDGEFVISNNISHLSFELNGGVGGEVLTYNSIGNQDWRPISAWGLTGNTGLTDGVNNFIGTTDNIPIRFLQSNLDAGVLDNSVTRLGYASNGGGVVIGAGAGNNGSGDGVFIGYNSGTGQASSRSVYIGENAQNGGGGDYSVCVGYNSFVGGNSVANNGSISIGVGATAVGNGVISIGNATNNTADNSISLGSGAISLSSDEFAIGTQTHLNFELNGGSAGYVLTYNSSGNQDWQPISAWGLTGNTGLTDGVDNFDGTNDNVAKRFILNGQYSGRLDADVGSDSFGYNCFLGYRVGQINIPDGSNGKQNTAFGWQSFTANNIGSRNTAFGYSALYQSTLSRNSAFGAGALESLQNGEDNTAVGDLAGTLIVDGINNTLIGSSATNTGDVNNTIALGHQANALSSNEFAIGTQDHLNFELNGATVGYALMCDAANSQIWKPVVQIGDVADVANSTKVVVDDADKRIDTYCGTDQRSTMVGKVFSLSDNVTTSIIEIALPAGSMTGGFLSANITATDGTNFQTHADIFTYTGVNKAGVYTTDITNSGTNDSISVSSGTLAVTWSIISGVDKIIIQVNANSSLTAPTITLRLSIANNGGQNVTIL